MLNLIKYKSRTNDIRKVKKYITTPLILGLFCFFIFCGCSSETSTPSTVVEKYFNAIKTSNFKEAQMYMTSDSDSTFIEEPNENEAISKAIFNAYKNISYNILETSENGDAATVKTKLTVPDLGSIFTDSIAEYFKYAMANALSENPDSDEDVNKYLENLLVDKINSKDIKTITSTTSIKLKKVSEKWLIEGNDELLDAISGSLASVIKGFNQNTATFSNTTVENKIDPNILGGRKNPVGLNETITGEYTGYSDGEGTYNISLLEIKRGDEVSTIVSEANQFNAPPKEGNEFLMAKFNFKLTTFKSSSDSAYNSSSYNFDIVSSDGNVYNKPTAFLSENLIDGEMYEGAEKEGWVLFEVSKSDSSPLIKFYDKIWFKIN